jgi:hypothetical protein
MAKVDYGFSWSFWFKLCFYANFAIFGDVVSGVAWTKKPTAHWDRAAGEMFAFPKVTAA